MTTENYNTKQKQVYFKAYKHLFLLENALEHIKQQEGDSNFQISILGKVVHFYIDKDLEVSNNTDTIKKFWKNQLGNTVNFGSFYNPEIGNVFIAGSLVPTFLHIINGKALAALTSGPYGIFRGIGANESQAAANLKLLNKGNYLLIFRGFEDELHNLENILTNN